MAGPPIARYQRLERLSRHELQVAAPAFFVHEHRVEATQSSPQVRRIGARNFPLGVAGLGVLGVGGLWADPRLKDANRYGSKLTHPDMDRRFWSMFPPRVPFGLPIFDPQPNDGSRGGWRQQLALGVCPGKAKLCSKQHDAPHDAITCLLRTSPAIQAKSRALLCKAQSQGRKRQQDQQHARHLGCPTFL